VIVPCATSHTQIVPANGPEAGTVTSNGRKPTLVNRFSLTNTWPVALSFTRLTVLSKLAMMRSPFMAPPK
jgi:hypothetical protein